MKQVYRHIRLDTNTPFYVGKASNNRAYSKQRNSYWKNIVAKVGYRIEIIKEFSTDNEALVFEAKMISLYKKFGHCEANIIINNAGGYSGAKRTNEHKKKYSESKMGAKNPNFGKSPWNKGLKPTEEFKQKCSDVQKGLQSGEKHGMFGRKQTEEARKRISDGKKGKPWSKIRRTAYEARKGG